MQFNLKINGTDFSRAFNSIGYGVSYLKIEVAPRKGSVD